MRWSKALRIERECRLASSPTLGRCERLDVSFPGEEELQEAEPLVAARLVQAKQYKIILQSRIFHNTRPAFAEICKLLDGVFRVVIIPRHTIVLQEREKLILIPQQAIPDRLGSFGLWGECGHALEVRMNVFSVAGEVVTFETVIVNRRDDLPEQAAKRFS